MENRQTEIKKISVVLPIYKEEGCIEKLLEAIEQSINFSLEFVLVDDGSTDTTPEILKNYKLNKPSNSKKVLILSRNFGHQQALMAGLNNVSQDSDLILVMDADFQDRPEEIPILINKINEGYDCVYAIRRERKEGFLLRILTKVFYKLVTNIASFEIPPYAGTFSIFNRKVLEKILLFSETDIYFPGLRAYVGYKQTGIALDRGQRAYAKSRVGLIGLMDLSSIAIFSFSAVPMRVIFVFGIIITLLCIILGFLVFILKIAGVTKIPGITTTLMFIIIFSGIQITFIGIVGEYIGRLFREAKKRPRWIIKETINEG
jgi:dolichol-phosphate mannosyltransferase